MFYLGGSGVLFKETILKRLNYSILLSVLIVISSNPCGAEIYKWVDKNGKVHFTDSRNNIPKNSKVEARREIDVTAPTKKPSSQLELKSPDSILESRKPQKGEVDKKKLHVSKPNSRQKEILEEMENEIFDLRDKLKESEARFNTVEEESIETSQEAFYDIDYSDEHREDRHALQRKAYQLGEELTKSRSDFFNKKENLKYKEYQLEEFRHSLEKK
jgi:hypothetical protein